MRAALQRSDRKLCWRSLVVVNRTARRNIVMIKRAMRRAFEASLFAAALASSLDASAQVPEYYPAPRSIESTESLQWAAGAIAASASTGLTEITVTTRVPLFTRIGHSIDIQ